MARRATEKVAGAAKNVAKAVQSKRAAGAKSSSRGIMPEVAKGGRNVGKAVKAKMPPKKVAMKRRANGDPRMPRYS